MPTLTLGSKSPAWRSSRSTGMPKWEPVLRMYENRNPRSVLKDQIERQLKFRHLFRVCPAPLIQVVRPLRRL